MNGPALMSHGYKYADTGLFYATHHPLAWSLHKKAYEMGTGRYWRHASRYARLDRSPEEYWMALRQEIEDCFLPFYIISSEEFGVVLDLHVITQLLVEYLSDLEVKFIVYIRRQDQFLQSVYNQAVKGEEDRFTGDFWSYVQPILNEGGADYLKLLSIIADVFGDSNIIVRVYEKEQLRENIFVDFLDAIGISNYAEFQFPQNVYNPGLSNRALLIARALNRVPVSADVRTHLMNRLQSLCVTQQPFLEHDFLSPRERVELLRRFDRSNEIVARRFLGRADGRLFHAPEPYPETQWDDKLSTADALGLLELMAELWIYYLTLVGPETTVNHLRDQMITVIRQNFLSGTRPVYIWGAGGGGQKDVRNASSGRYTSCWFC